MFRQSRAQIIDEWLRLLATCGLPHQRSEARSAPDALRARIEHTIGLIITYLSAPDPAAQRDAREALLAKYRLLGRRWAEEEGAEPALAVGPPRLMQAASNVLLTGYAPDLTAQELQDCVLALNALVMDLAMARIYGYISYKEELLAAQQQTVSRLLDELTHVETKERRSLALELHDSLAQRLVSLFSGIQHCERLIERDVKAAHQELLRLRRIAQETIRGARVLIRDLHFGVIDHGGGFAALGDYIGDLEADTGIRHHFRVTGCPADLAPVQEALVIRIVQEALINAHKHAAANRIDISVEERDGALVVAIRDNGRGFQVEEALARSRRRGRFGLIGMRERAQLLGATLEIESCPGRGTSVRLEMPPEAQHD